MNKAEQLAKEQLANEHWAFLQRWSEMIFKDGFLHGFGHGVEWQKKQAKTEK